MRGTTYFMTRSFFSPLLLLSFASFLSAQSPFWENYTFTQADTLRGALRAERTCYDVTFYDLDVRVDMVRRSLEGYVDIHFIAKTDFHRLQIDLFANMQISRIEFEGRSLNYERVHNAVFVAFPRQRKGKRAFFRVYYYGRPKEAENPPWDGGFIWTQDKAGRPWVAVACQGIGASLWWPNKDHLSDEPDSLSIKLTIPSDLQGIANGRLRSVSRRGNERCFHWFVSYPVNNYNVSINIGNYAHFADRYRSTSGDTLSLDYYVIKENEQIAKTHFSQVKGALRCFEEKLGPYPFPLDGFALIEAPYNGMEHQSGIAYGNRFQTGYLGVENVPGISFDYVIVHETAHEYFGNSLSCKDIAQIWLHESFTTYMESVYVECQYGYRAALRYLAAQRHFIENEFPIAGPLNVNWDHWDNGDNYHKGAWVLHSMRNVLNKDEQWFALLRQFYELYQYQQVDAREWIYFVNEFTGQDFRPFFQQYLYYPNLPAFEYRLRSTEKGVKISYRWQADVSEFDMPLRVNSGEETAMLYPTERWQEMELAGFDKERFRIAEELFLIEVRRSD